MTNGTALYLFYLKKKIDRMANVKRSSTSCSVQQTTEVLNKQIFPFSVLAAALPI